MSYLGQEPTYGNLTPQTLTGFDGVNDTFTLTYPIASPASVLFVLNGVIQHPGIDYKIIEGGVKIKTTTPPAANSTGFLLFLGKKLTVSSYLEKDGDSATGKMTFSFGLNLGSLPSFADDTAAAAGGVSVGDLYRNGSALFIRVS